MTVPAPPVFANVTTVALSVVTVLPFTSSRVAVSVWVSPAVVEPLSVSVICVAAPWTTVKPIVPSVSAPLLASRTIAPTRAPVMVLVAMPATAVSLPVPVTVPAPEALANVTTLVLSEVTVLPAASWIVAVRTRVAPEVRLVVAPVRAIWVAAPWTIGEGAERAGRQPGGGGFHRHRADELAGDRLGGDAGDGGVVAGAGDGAGAGRLGERDDGACCRR